MEGEIEMLRGEVENGRKKLEMMGKKLETKMEEVRKKDEFVQNVVMGKMKEGDKGVQGWFRSCKGTLGKVIMRGWWKPRRRLRD